MIYISSTKNSIRGNSPEKGVIIDGVNALIDSAPSKTQAPNNITLIEEIHIGKSSSRQGLFAKNPSLS